MLEIRFDLFDEKDREHIHRLLDLMDQLSDSPVNEGGDEKATDKQVWLLKRLGFEGDIGKLSKLEASEHIKKLKEEN